MKKYPEYIRQFKPKGTIVKKVRDTYYVYKATSKRVEGKSYPVQVIEGLEGRIDEQGFHRLSRTVVANEHVIIREYGFTNYLLLFEKNYILDTQAHRKKKDAIIIYRSLIAYLSSNTYLTDEKDILIYSIDELITKYKISITKQISAILKITEEANLERLEPLKYICRVKMGDKIFKSELSNIQKKLIEVLGVDEDVIR